MHNLGLLKERVQKHACSDDHNENNTYHRQLLNILPIVIITIGSLNKNTRMNCNLNLSLCMLVRNLISPKFIYYATYLIT